jgi:nucleotide-binding universal stress UspA family protein
VVAERDPADTSPPIGVQAVAGSPAAVLLDVARNADLLVLGHRGHGAFSSALLGSVGLQCVLHPTCPVTIVRPTPSGSSSATADTEAAAVRS